MRHGQKRTLSPPADGALFLTRSANDVAARDCRLTTGAYLLRASRGRPGMLGATPACAPRLLSVGFRTRTHAATSIPKVKAMNLQRLRALSSYVEEISAYQAYNPTGRRLAL